MPAVQAKTIPALRILFGIAGAPAADAALLQALIHRRSDWAIDDKLAGKARQK
jgi:hypothetical protein